MNPKLTIFLLLVALLLAPAAPLLAQCAMCRENAAAADGGKAINLGIFVLLIPTLSLFVGVLAFALARRDSDADTVSLKLAEMSQAPRTSPFRCEPAD